MAVEQGSLCTAIMDERNMVPDRCYLNEVVKRVLLIQNSSFDSTSKATAKNILILQ